MYELSFVDRAEIGGDDGGCSTGSLTLKVANDLSPQRKGRVSFHEIGHALFDEFNINIPETIEDRIINAFEGGLTCLAQDEYDTLIEIIKLMGGRE